MNPLKGQATGLPNDLKNSIGQVRNLMSLTQGNFMQVLQNNPQLSQLMQVGNPQQMFYSMCQQRGVDANAVLKELGML